MIRILHYQEQGSNIFSLKLKVPMKILVSDKTLENNLAFLLSNIVICIFLQLWIHSDKNNSQFLNSTCIIFLLLDGHNFASGNIYVVCKL